MTTIVLKLSELPASYRSLGPRLMSAAMRGAARGAMHAVSTLQRATSAAPPANPNGVGQGGAVNTGFYKRAWKWRATPDGALVYNVASYASVIEKGRRPGKFPPKEVIVRWIQRRMGKSLKEAQALAFVVRRAIARRGLLARNVAGGARKDIEANFWVDVLAELDRELRKHP